MPKPLTQQDITFARCGHPEHEGGMHRSCKLHMRSQCHPGSPTQSCYDKHRGVMTVTCAACGAHVAEFQVAAAPAAELAFEVSAPQLLKFRAWLEEHKPKCPPGDAAIGGQYTWEFTGTGLGHVTVVRCACGEQVDLTPYETW